MTPDLQSYLSVRTPGVMLFYSPRPGLVRVLRVPVAISEQRNMSLPLVPIAVVVGDCTHDEVARIAAPSDVARMPHNEARGHQDSMSLLVHDPVSSPDLTVDL